MRTGRTDSYTHAHSFFDLVSFSLANFEEKAGE